ncbi:MAG: type IIA DNA topoisomerase subunit B [Chitinophagales bacterium]|nr:type IIA DNA topoisomerase subunit B [Chitinophagales bacterium]
MSEEVKYTEDNIRSLDWKEHMRLRPGMYIGKTGDGSSQDDGIYILVKEIIDNCIDEFVMGHGKKVDITVEEKKVFVRDYGRGIPLGKVVDAVSKINTGGKYDSQAFKKSVGLNGVGTKAVNALSSNFKVESVREGRKKIAIFEKGNLLEESEENTTEANGTAVEFVPDDLIFKKYKFIPDYLENQIWNYAYLNSGLTINYNGQRFLSKQGLRDLLERKTDENAIRYPIIHFKSEDIEFALVHDNHYGEEYYSYVNGQHTVQGGTHLNAFKEAIVKTLREFYNKSFDPQDIRASIVGAISIRMQDPIFESQTKTKLGSNNIDEETSMRVFVGDYVKQHLDDFLHKNSEVAEKLLKKIQQSERERKDMAGVKKLAKDRAKKANLHNKKLRDCRYHFDDKKNEKHISTSIFITEGDSASGSITKARDVETQAVFSLRGKPLNSYGLKKKIVYENEEFNLLQHALNIEEGLENLRYNNVIIATDADVDGMHIRLLLLTFFLQFFPDLVKEGHVKVLETPLFRVRDKKQTFYCYSEEEKLEAVEKLRGKAEITRFKGLGEISPNEFEDFIGENIRLSPVILTKENSIEQILSYYMGKNTPERQDFIIDNLKVEKDIEEEILK